MHTKHTKKIDLKLLRELLAEGKSQRECADIIGVSPAAISKAVRALKQEHVRSLPPETSQKIFDQVLDLGNGLKSLFQLTSTKERAIALELEQARGDKRMRLHDIHLRCLGELRSIWALRHQAVRTFYSADMFEDLKESISDAIKDEAPHVQEKVIENFEQKLP